jgi:hypothetical protein
VIPPPERKAAGSNPAGCANQINNLATFQREASSRAQSYAHPRKRLYFVKRAEPAVRGCTGSSDENRQTNLLSCATVSLPSSTERLLLCRIL